MKDTIVNDAELVLLLETGNEHAFQEIYDRYWHKLYRMAVGKVGSQENAKELVQDVFLDLWFRRGEVRIGELDRYLFSAVKYNVLNFIRKEIVRKQYELSVFAKTPDTDCNTEDTLAFQELQQAIMTGIEQLPDAFVFREVSLSAVLEKLEKAYGVEIEVSNESLNNCRITADLSKDDLYGRLEIICAAVNARFELADDKVMIAGRGCDI
ncbi:MAG: hypothetical protein ABS46_00830 [Cytophagaceae bacterium SCN 52-12]|nr:MAG: hypothetical protein ABS46_00830 [Cytophagaceae bacterium SCN 52-12]